MWFAAAVCMVTGVRLYVMTSVPLTGDEAYHWQWARHLALGYYDHPPLIAWLIALFNGALGSSVFSTRLAGPLCAALTAWFVYRLAGEVSGSRRAGTIAGTMLLVSPLPGVGAMAVIPDTPLLPAWIAAVYFLYRALFRDHRASWIFAGVALGIGMLSKLMACFLLPSLFAFLILSPPHRAWLRRPQPYLFVLVGLLVASPFLWWNATHGWLNFTYQASFRLGGASSAGPWLQPRYAIDFLLYQIVELFPLLFAMYVVVFAGLAVAAWRGDSRALFLAAFAAGIIGFFATISLHRRTSGHWPFVGYLTLMAASGWMYERRGRGFRVALVAAIAGSAMMTTALYAVIIRPQTLFALVDRYAAGHRAVNKGETLQSRMLAEPFGYPGAGRVVAATIAEMSRARPTFVVTESYALSSVLAFYSGLDTHVLRGSVLGRAYDEWNRFDELAGQDAVFVDLAPFGSRPDSGIL